MASDALYLVLSNPASADVEGDFNRWYDDEHIHHALALPGWRAATRYRSWTPAVPPELASRYVPEQRYLTMYEWDPGDPQARLDALAAAHRDGRIDTSPSLDIDSLRGFVYLPITDRVAVDG
jgi:hypothetical protein